MQISSTNINKTSIKYSKVIQIFITALMWGEMNVRHQFPPSLFLFKFVLTNSLVKPLSHYTPRTGKHASLSPWRQKHLPTNIPYLRQAQLLILIKLTKGSFLRGRCPHSTGKCGRDAYRVHKQYRLTVWTGSGVCKYTHQ